MKTFLRFILLIGTVIQIVACITFPAGGIPGATPTPTKVISAVEQTSEAAPNPQGASENINRSDCLQNANGVALTGQPCIQGAYDIHHDTTTSITPQNTRQEHTPLDVQFSLWAIAPGQLQGTAHLTYSVKATIIDAGATGCQVQTEVVKLFSWDVDLNGQYFTEPDGGIRVILQATPAQGPSYTEKFEDCPIPEREAPGVSGRLWAENL